MNPDIRPVGLPWACWQWKTNFGLAAALLGSCPLGFDAGDEEPVVPLRLSDNVDLGEILFEEERGDPEPVESFPSENLSRTNGDWLSGWKLVISDTGDIPLFSGDFDFFFANKRFISNEAAISWKDHEGQGIVEWLTNWPD